MNDGAVPLFFLLIMFMLVSIGSRIDTTNKLLREVKDHLTEVKVEQNDQ